MRLEIDIPEHHYNNIIAFDSVSLGRVPYKGIIMYAINAIKRGKALAQEPTEKPHIKGDYYDGFKNGLRTAEWRYGKIRAEIDLETRIQVKHYMNTDAVIDEVLDVIDKYKAESEDT